MPFPFQTSNPTVFPSNVDLKAVPDPYNYHSIWPVEDGVTYVYLDSDRGYMKRTVLAEETAKGVVEDYIGSMIYADPMVHPGIFWVPGELNYQQIEQKHAKELKEIRAIQDQWFTRVVEAADDEWSRAKHHRSIAPVQKLAAKALGLDREWIIQASIASTVKFNNCPACRSLVDALAVICGNCRCIINAEEYSKFHFASPALAPQQLASAVAK